MEAFEEELIEQTHTEVEGGIFWISTLFPKRDNKKNISLQVFKATSDLDTM